MLPLNYSNGEIGMLSAGFGMLLVHELYVRLVLTRSPEAPAWWRHGYFGHPLVRERLAGMVLMGVAPLALLRPWEHWLGWSPSIPEASLILIIMLAVTLFAVWASVRFDRTGDGLPEAVFLFGSRQWLLNTLVWTGYLAAYEFMLRGLLFFPLLSHVGRLPAVAINIVLYAALHIKKGRLETAGALPFGALLCVVTLLTHSIWPAFLIHLNLALIMDSPLGVKSIQSQPNKLQRP